MCVLCLSSWSRDQTWWRTRLLAANGQNSALREGLLRLSNKKQMLSMSESRVYPYQRLGETPTTCDFCGSKPVQAFKFDLELSFNSEPVSARTLFVCESYECQEKLDASIVAFNKNEGRIPLTRVQRACPKMLLLTYTVRRSNGEVDEGWSVPIDWASRCEFSTLQRMRGEPWWRIVLQKGQSIRHTFVHELRELNADKLDKEEWDAVFATLPLKPTTPEDTFLEFYRAEDWTLEAPSDKQLQGLRIAD
jgi:hypothetical protein